MEIEPVLQLRGKTERNRWVWNIAKNCSPRARLDWRSWVLFLEVYSIANADKHLSGNSVMYLMRMKVATIDFDAGVDDVTEAKILFAAAVVDADERAPRSIKQIFDANGSFTRPIEWSYPI
jgi:Ni,Fe-hydrogenase III component G